MIEIVKYRANWWNEFHEIAACLREGLADLAERIDHIGSTSVPGLAAKDIIDIQVTVAALDERIVQAMEAMGYTGAGWFSRDHATPYFNGTDSEWEKLFFHPPPGQRRTNTHVRARGRANQRYALLFRDYLRTHPHTAKAYEELKRQLAQHLADPELYPEVKDPAVDLIYLAAEEWAAARGWQPGPPDA
jgi:GrpB-like predicted nucleotidyltransferase (UPF0157 family)